jgi:hypothetical protein
MTTKSKFAALLETRRTEPPQEPEQKAVEPAMAQQTADKPKAPAQAVKRPRGRPGGQGKRINPAYTQVTAYIPENLHLETKINLLRNGKREFSQLVEELLDKWNRAQVSTSAG